MNVLLYVSPVDCPVDCEWYRWMIRIVASHDFCGVSHDGSSAEQAKGLE